MLKIFILVLILMISAIFIFNYFLSEKNNEKLISFELEGKKYLLKKANNPQEWQDGLMFIEKPVNYNGMIFIFPDKQIRSFWNKNTFIDLDIYWLDDDKIIGKDFLPSINSSKELITKTSPMPVNKVIEIIKD
jgi:uncharacterized membrane protein (UPF0127 family)